MKNSKKNKGHNTINFPKTQQSSLKGETGLTIVKSIVERKLGWKFRKNHQEDDFGIDAYLDIVTDLGYVTGKSIAVQIKTGKSYFEEQNNYGWIYRDDLAHLNYYLNQDIPVVILLVNDLIDEVYWCYCDSSKTERTGEKWKITVPFKQKLQSSSKNELLKCISEVTDYVAQLEHFWNVNKMLSEQEKIILLLTKEDITSKNYPKLISTFARFEVNPQLIHDLRGRIDIAIDGYNDVSDELYAIPEVRDWLKDILKQIHSWCYFLSMEKDSQFLKVLVLANIRYRRISSGKVEYERKDFKNFLNTFFDGLNKFCENHNISESINEERCDKLMEYMTEGEYKRWKQQQSANRKT